MKSEEKIFVREVLKLIRGDLQTVFPYLGEALAFPEWKETAGNPGTDGLSLYWNPAEVLAQFRKDTESLRRVYLHLIYHNLYQHPLRRAEEEQSVWDAACDLMTEYRIDRL